MSASDYDAPGREYPRWRLSGGVPPESIQAPAQADGSRDAASEDFLFHLYRGSELLQDNRVLEAKSELEHALTLQPRDPKGQDLLAVVYFRIGLYPHAIQIYEELLRQNPRDHSLRLNLALCSLKTGQAQAAREQLEVVVHNNPAHKRAWGYLGLAFERLGDVDKALHAFERGSHTQMAKRLLERGKAATSGPPVVEVVASTENAEIRAAASAAFEELDAGELSFSLAAQEQPSKESGQWRAIEPGASAAPVSISVPALGNVAPFPVPFPVPEERRHLDTLEWGLARGTIAPFARSGRTVPRPVADFAREARLVFPEDGVAVVDGALALVGMNDTPVGRSFAARLESIRSYSGNLKTEVMERQLRGQVGSDTFGGVGTPIVRVSGAGQLVLGPRPSHNLVSFLLRDEVAFVREEHLLGFDHSLEYENGRLAVGEGEGTHMVQLRGTGTVLLELVPALATLEVKDESSVAVRREVLIGWVGRLAPRALSIGEAPCGQRGLIGFSGDGTVLVAAR